MHQLAGLLGLEVRYLRKVSLRAERGPTLAQRDSHVPHEPYFVVRCPLGRPRQQLRRDPCGGLLLEPGHPLELRDCQRERQRGARGTERPTAAPRPTRATRGCSRSSATTWMGPPRIPHRLASTSSASRSPARGSHHDGERHHPRSGREEPALQRRRLRARTRPRARSPITRRATPARRSTRAIRSSPRAPPRTARSRFRTCPRGRTSRSSSRSASGGAS